MDTCVSAEVDMSPTVKESYCTHEPYHHTLTIRLDRPISLAFQRPLLVASRRLHRSIIALDFT